MKRIVILIFILFGICLTACQAEMNLDEPPEIIYGEDICDECSMIISESRFASSMVTVDGDVKLFDDIGDMLKYDSETDEQIHIYWVHDYVSEDWLNADEAVFVLSDDLVTPMGWGLAAFAENETAEEYIADIGGVVTTFATLQAEISSGTLDLANFTGHHHDHEDGHPSATDNN